MSWLRHRADRCPPTPISHRAMPRREKSRLSCHQKRGIPLRGLLGARRSARSRCYGVNQSELGLCSSRTIAVGLTKVLRGPAASASNSTLADRGLFGPWGVELDAATAHCPTDPARRRPQSCVVVKLRLRPTSKVNCLWSTNFERAIWFVTIHAQCRSE